MAKEKEIKLVFSSEKYEELEAKIAELDEHIINLKVTVEQRGQSLEIREKEVVESNKKIAELETELKRINKLSVERCNKNLEHLNIRKSCAVELQAWNSSGALDPIIEKLEGKE